MKAEQSALVFLNWRNFRNSFDPSLLVKILF